jgi:hypothetical protein
MIAPTRKFVSRLVLTALALSFLASPSGAMARHGYHCKVAADPLKCRIQHAKDGDYAPADKGR